MKTVDKELINDFLFCAFYDHFTKLGTIDRIIDHIYVLYRNVTIQFYSICLHFYEHITIIMKIKSIIL